MVTKASRRKRPQPKRTRPPRPPRVYPNRIHELAQQKRITYDEIGERIGAHSITIAKLASGRMQLTQSWMQRLAVIFGVEPSELIAKPLAAGLRRVRVSSVASGGAGSGHELSEHDRYDVMVPDISELRDLELYAAEISGDSMNLRYPSGSVVVMSRLNGANGSEVTPGRRYHARITHPDGSQEVVVKTLVREQGRTWLKPESSSPEHQAWVEVTERVELLGRVRYAVQRED